MAPGRSADQNAFVLPKLRIDVLVQDESARPVADAVTVSSWRTGRTSISPTQ
jgi:hypothetical protein